MIIAASARHDFFSWTYPYLRYWVVKIGIISALLAVRRKSYELLKDLALSIQEDVDIYYVFPMYNYTVQSERFYCTAGTQAMPAKHKSMDITHERAGVLLGLAHQVIGKSEARQQFLPLVKQLKQKLLAFEITDRDECVAVMMSKVHYDALINKLWELLKPTSEPETDELMGCITIVGNLEAGSKRAADRFKQAIRKTAEAL